MTAITTAAPITPKQAAFILRLLNQLDPSQPDLNAEAMQMYDAMTKRQASAEIDKLLAQVERVRAERKPQAQPEPKATGEVPAGRYALAGEATDGEVEFYQIRYGKPGGRWEGFLFLDRLVGAPMDGRAIAVRDRDAKRRVLDDINTDIAGAAARFGREVGHCGFCAALLTDARSRAAGYGSTCAANHGLPY
jgi:Family of unknown function (DUF6011)